MKIFTNKKSGSKLYSDVGLNTIINFEVGELLWQSKILERGWSKSMIDSLLKFPDAYKQNPKYKSASPMKLYFLTRIEAAEKTQDFVTMSKKYKLKKVSSEKAVNTKISNIMDQVADMTVFVKKKKLDNLINDAICSYNCRIDNLRLENEYATKDSDPDFIVRITVNFVRHSLTEYDSQLESVARKTGASLAYIEISKKVFSKIAEIYPALKSECDRQLLQRLGEPLETSAGLG